MTETTKPPYWAINRALELSGCDKQNYYKPMISNGDYHKSIEAFASYIVHIEEPPQIDPLLLEARIIAAKELDLTQEVKLQVFNGAWDHSYNVQTAYNALKRGVELGKA